MGHKTIAMSLRDVHLSPDHKRAAMEALEQRFSVPSPATFRNTPFAAALAKSEKQAAF